MKEGYLVLKVYKIKDSINLYFWERTSCPTYMECPN